MLRAVAWIAERREIGVAYADAARHFESSQSEAKQQGDHEYREAHAQSCEYETISRELQRPLMIHPTKSIRSSAVVPGGSECYNLHNQALGVLSRRIHDSLSQTC